jgi:[protein-PII] uridylyltransferase
MASARPAAEAIREARAELLGRPDLSGRTLARRLCDQMDGWFTALGAGLPEGWALGATGGYALGRLAPGSDIDVLLVHPVKGVSAAEIGEVASSVWYPLWDAGLKLSPATHSERSLAALAGGDLVTITSLLGIRVLAGDSAAVDAIRAMARGLWRKTPWAWLSRLSAANEERWFRHGDVASRLEPDLKDGRGGLRDHDAVRWALLTDREEVAGALEGPIEDLAAAASTLAEVRGELHRQTGRAANLLLLQDQDAVAAAAGYDDADEMMLAVSAAAHVIEWTSERFWARVEQEARRAGKGAKRSRPVDLGPAARLVGGEVQLTATADLDEQSTIFGVAALAAHGGHRLARGALLQMANVPAPEVERWTDRTRQEFVSLLGSGEQLVTVADALEFFGLFSRFLPEWQVVRSRPQRNAFHIYTVDRHLLQTVVEANDLVRTVSRPDLLLVGALLHDIGKGHPGDHTEVGRRLVVTIAERMGFPPSDVETLRTLVDCHLLLAETATRRDLDDPRTVEIVAGRVGDLETLELLRALTEADSRATGPTAWNTWKEGLVNALVHSTAAALRGVPVLAAAAHDSLQFADLVERWHGEGAACVDHQPADGFDIAAVASADRRGLFAEIAGTFALHGIEVVSADVWTSAEGAAVDRFHVRWATEPHWPRVERDLRSAVAGVLDVAAALEQRAHHALRSRRPQAAAAPKLEVLVSNEHSATTTMIDVRAPDGVAVLYRLAAALRDLGLDIRSAKVATLGHEVVDVFYVERVDEARHDAVRGAVKAALAGPPHSLSDPDGGSRRALGSRPAVLRDGS